MSKKSKFYRDALYYHKRKPEGKIEVIPTKKHSSQRDLALAYSPGVAIPCKEIEQDPSKVYDYTAKGNLVAVISNGTAVLGLGDIGPLASKPVMEGKGLLFKIFADINVFDIEVNETDPDKFVEIVKAIAPTFGGINLEDIKAPEAFKIEDRLKNELDIPVMHDDQHGTAIISSAALLNALEIAQKDISKVKIVVNGAGAAAMACTKLYISLGANKENITMCDSKGIITTDREHLSPQKQFFAVAPSDKHSLADALQGADVFIGLSVADVLTPEMLQTMASDPIVFAMANPDPEIDYNLAIETRSDIIMATGRSDFPNQVNNVLGFPYIFRGALDVHANSINEEMKIAAVNAIAKLAKETVPEVVLLAYNLNSLSFGKDYLIPKPFDQRLMTRVSMAVAKAAMESGVAAKPIHNWERYEETLLDRSGNDEKMIRMMQNKAKSNPKSIVMSNAEELDVLKAAQFLSEEGIAKPILLGSRERILATAKQYEIEIDLPIVDPKDENQKANREKYIKTLWEKRRRKGISKYQAEKLIQSRDYFAPMMVECGDADALITGYSKSYRDTLKPLLECIDNSDGVNKVACMTMMLYKNQTLFLADTSININPTWEEIVRITRMTSWVVKQMTIEPRVALLSFENFSNRAETSKKMQKAVSYMHKYFPSMIVDGEIQADFALIPELLEDYSFSKLYPKPANTLIFPDLASANISYKLLKGTGAAQSIGPILLGLSKPVHILQHRASFEEIVNLATLAVLDVQYRMEN